ncbi:MAG TPA: hypothetical protein VMV69_28725 [Pirellulales bacterium]|nr:hypothetical protein [Pirellulales bacterium]
MPITRSELVYLTTGIAVGALAGANADKVKKSLTDLFALVTEAGGDAYQAAAQKVAERVESLKDTLAEAKQTPDPAGPPAA